MKVRRSIRSTNEINLSSSSDIAFLLIIFFMVTSAFIFKDGLKLVLPAKNKEPKVIENIDDIAMVKLDNESLTLQDKKVTPLELESALADKVDDDPDAVVLMQIKKETSYMRVIEIVDVMKVARVSKLSMKMIEEGK